MRFTEHEMTVAVEAAARELWSATRPPWRRRRAVADWAALARAARYPRLVAAGDIVLPVLTALPERPTVGEVPRFEEHEWVAAATEGVREAHERRTEGSWEAMAPRRRRALVAVADRLTRVAVAALPPRQDPDALTG